MIMCTEVPIEPPGLESVVRAIVAIHNPKTYDVETEVEEEDRGGSADAGQDIEAPMNGWTFDSRHVARMFDEHVRLSVPQYDAVQELVTGLASYYVRADTTVIDIGCATGTTLRMLDALLPEMRVRLVGVDSALQMLDKANEKTSSDRVSFIHDDALKAVTGAAGPISVWLSIFSLQFIRGAARRELVQLIKTKMNAGDAFILVEKCACKHSEHAVMYNDLYHDAKVRAGYSDAQVSTKARSLRGVLEPLPSDFEYRVLNKGENFRLERFWQYLNFVGWLLVKTA